MDGVGLCARRRRLAQVHVQCTCSDVMQLGQWGMLCCEVCSRRATKPPAALQDDSTVAACK